jgi:phenylacetate-CoA ligase
MSLLANIAFGEREREVIAQLCGQSLRYATAAILYPESTTEKVQALYRRWTFIPVRPGQSNFSVLQPFEAIMEGLRQLRPGLIIGYGSWLEAFFRMIEARALSLPLPRAVLYVAEGMTREGVDLIESRFGIPVISQYNAMEAFKIGFTCDRRNGFHLHDDLCIVRIVREDGTDAPAGEKGEIVISNLVNRGSVLLNYRLGDIGTLSGAVCGCGRTLPLLTGIEGRAEDILFLPDGRFVHPRAVWAVIRKSEGILKYQLIQHEPERFELRLVTGGPDVRAEIIRALKPLLGGTAVIEATCFPDLLPAGREKFRPVISMCRPGMTR